MGIRSLLNDTRCSNVRTGLQRESKRDLNHYRNSLYAAQLPSIRHDHRIHDVMLGMVADSTRYLVQPLVLLGLFAVLMLLAACGETGSESFDSSVETTIAGTVTADQPPLSIGLPKTSIFCPDCRLVDVTGVVDGDTIDTSSGRVRFFGVDTPERGDACFSEATDFTRMLVGSQVRLEDGPRLEDSFGRRLAYVYDPSGNSIDVQLVAGGFARAWARDGQHRDVLVGLEQSAKSNQAGCLWTGGSFTETSQYAPSGPDRDCGDFGTWREANDFYVAAGGPERDLHQLDGDGDGVPCESLR